MPLEEALDHEAFMNLGIVENHHDEDFGKALMKLMQKLYEYLGDATLGPFPIKPLRAQM